MLSELALLECLEQAEQPLTAAEIVARSGLPRSTVFKLLRRLMRNGYVWKQPETARYSLGPRLIRLGICAQRHLSANGAITPELIELRNRTGETVTFSILQGGMRVCAAVLEGYSDLRHVAQVGAQYPLHLGAAGKAILAYLDETLVRSVLAGQGLTPAQEARVVEHLAEVRRTGYAVATSERVAGACAVAAPVFAGSHVFGSVAVVGPTERMTPVVPALVPLVVGTARRLTEKISLSPFSRARSGPGNSVAGGDSG